MEAAGGDGEPEALSCFSYNQDCTSLAIGTKTGYKLFSLSSVDQLDQVHESNEIPDVYIVERLFSSSLVVVVSRSKPRQMNVYHFKKGTEICNYSYSSDILSIRLNRQRLIVCLEESIYIHNIKDMKLLKTIPDIPPNTTGLCALSINHSNSYLAYPGSTTVGEIVLYDGYNLRDVCSISAHDGPLAALAFNSTGSKLASASEKGTVIRVFSIPEGQKLYEFRRGMKRYVNISSLVFSMDSQFLCASSNTETVHIFKLEHLTDRWVSELVCVCCGEPSCILEISSWQVVADVELGDLMGEDASPSLFLSQQEEVSHCKKGKVIGSQDLLEGNLSIICLNLLQL